MARFVIFTLARTGSTTLLKLLNCHPSIRCAFEPFSPTNIDEFLRQCHDVRRTHGLEAALARLWTRYNGFKHVWTWAGWPFTDNPYLNQQVLVGSGARIILLHRRNSLRRAMSVQISNQMQLWTFNSPEEQESIRQHSFGALDIPRLREEMETAQRAMSWARTLLARSPVTWRELAYEDLLESALPLETRVEVIQSLFDFLGVPRTTESERLREMSQLFDPAFTGFRNVEAYDKIPNIAEVDRALSSDTTGHI